MTVLHKKNNNKRRNIPVHKVSVVWMQKFDIEVNNAEEYEHNAILVS